MAREPLDITKPGPAGMWFDTSILTQDGLAADRAAQASLTHWCCGCGVEASFGYGVFSDQRPGEQWACDDPECRQEARARAAAALAAPARPKASADLFSLPVAAE